MKKRGSLIVFLLILFFINSISAIKITEIELNPAGKDAGNEWIEIYSREELNLNSYKLVNNDGDEVELNGSFSDYLIYVFEKQWLDNSDEKVFLYKDSELIFATDLFDDSKNNGQTWQLCNQEWLFLEPTKRAQNDCGSGIDEIVRDTPEEEIPEPENPENKEENFGTQEEDKDVKFEEISYSNENVTEKKEIKTIEFETIKLNNPENLKDKENKEKINKNTLAIYGFVGFNVLIVFLFLIKIRKNLMYKSEFEV